MLVVREKGVARVAVYGVVCDDNSSKRGWNATGSWLLSNGAGYGGVV